MAKVFKVHPGAAYTPVYNMEVFYTASTLERLVKLRILKGHPA